MNTALVQAVLNRLALAEVAWAPRFVGIEHGDEILSWLPGAPMHDWASAPERLDGLTVIVRQLHDLTVGWVPGVECVVHDDLQPRNVVVATDGQLGLIDWEQCRAGQRIEDVAQLCWSFLPPTPHEPVDPMAVRWRRVLDLYGTVDATSLVAVATAKVTRCVDDIIRQADQGSVRHQILRDRGDHEELHLIQRWLGEHGHRLADALR